MGTQALPAPDKPRRHVWDRVNPRRVSAVDSFDKNERVERSCKVCGLIKITVIPALGAAYRQWRSLDGKRVWGQREPACGGG